MIRPADPASHAPLVDVSPDASPNTCPVIFPETLPDDLDADAYAWPVDEPAQASDAVVDPLIQARRWQAQVRPKSSLLHRGIVDRPFFELCAAATALAEAPTGTPSQDRDFRRQARQTISLAGRYAVKPTPGAPRLLGVQAARIREAAGRRLREHFDAELDAGLGAQAGGAHGFGAYALHAAALRKTFPERSTPAANAVRHILDERGRTRYVFQPLEPEIAPTSLLPGLAPAGPIALDLAARGHATHDPIQAIARASMQELLAAALREGMNGSIPPSCGVVNDPELGGGLLIIRQPPDAPVSTLARQFRVLLKAVAPEFLPVPADAPAWRRRTPAPGSTATSMSGPAIPGASACASDAQPLTPNLVEHLKALDVAALRARLKADRISLARVLTDLRESPLPVEIDALLPEEALDRVAQRLRTLATLVAQDERQSLAQLVRQLSTTAPASAAPSVDEETLGDMALSAHVNAVLARRNPTAFHRLTLDTLTDSSSEEGGAA